MILLMCHPLEVGTIWVRNSCVGACKDNANPISGKSLARWYMRGTTPTVEMVIRVGDNPNLPVSCMALQADKTAT